MAIETSQSEHSSSGSATGLFSNFNFSRRITDKDRHLFTERMALLLSTGNNLHTSLQSLKGQIDNPQMELLIDRLIDDVGEGQQFSSALAKHPRVFSQTYINLIAASEEGGFMDEVMEQLLEMDEKREQLQRTLFASLSYPAFLFVFAIAVIIFVLVVVFPKFTDLFSGIQDELPTTTLVLMSASEIFREHWIAIPATLIISLLLLRFWAVSDTGRHRIDWIKLHVPGFKGIFMRLYLLQSMRVLGLSLKNGVGIVDALNACREVVHNRLYHEFISNVISRVQAGDGIANGFKNNSFIPPMVQQMIKTGEETSNLPKVLEKIADYYERELTTIMATFSRLAEPIMLLIMGGVVGLVVSSLILPIFKLSSAVH